MDTNWRSGSILSVGFLAAVSWLGCFQTPEQRLGERLVDDQNLSAHRNQACSSCHSPDTGGTGPSSDQNLHQAVYEGSIPGRFGNRKPPANTYATSAPRFDYVEEVGFVGGNFWDGRATGWELGNPAADQAKGPFLNPVEQALPNAKELVDRVCSSDYGGLFRNVHGPKACKEATEGYAAIAKSIAVFEDSAQVNALSSKYDASRVTSKVKLDDREAQGLTLFEGKGHCVQCHTIHETRQATVFTDFTFDNLGLPANPENPFYQMDAVLVDGAPVNPAGRAWVDPGLGGFLAGLTNASAWRALPYVTPTMRDMPDARIASLAEANRGKHRVPSLRNVDKRPAPNFVKAYGHNGFFKSLKGIVHFYNTRDVLPTCSGALTEAEALQAECWPAPEVPENVNRAELGDLQLTDEEEDAIVAFLGTLSDGWATDEGRSNGIMVQ